VNKSELIEHIAKQADISKAAAARSLEALIGAVKTTLKKGNTVTITGFGTFTAPKRAARTGRNPRTGAAIKIKAAKVPKFRPWQGPARRDVIRACRVLSSAGRAAPLQGVGRRFEPVSTHQLS
jgi:DNA-binding protein HU-beta